jgi:hypothetical protein
MKLPMRSIIGIYKDAQTKEIRLYASRRHDRLWHGLGRIHGSVKLALTLADTDHVIATGSKRNK